MNSIETPSISDPCSITTALFESLGFWLHPENDKTKTNTVIINNNLKLTVENMNKNKIEKVKINIYC